MAGGNVARCTASCSVRTQRSEGLMLRSCVFHLYIYNKGRPPAAAHAESLPRAARAATFPAAQSLAPVLFSCLRQPRATIRPPRRMHTLI